MPAELLIKQVSPFDADVSRLIDELDHYQQELYPPESNHLDSRETLSEVNCRLLGAFRGNRLLGIGAAKFVNGYAELKRFYVTQEARGRGTGDCLIAALERQAYARGARKLCLETGVHQAAALKFYDKLGYRRCEPFGDYRPDPLSVFMEKDLERCEVILREHRGPFYVVAFTSQLKEHAEGYAESAAAMVERVQGEPGFIGMISAGRNDLGEGFTSSFWRSRDDIRWWRENRSHQEAQRRGREEFYASFRTTIARVEE